MNENKENMFGSLSDVEPVTTSNTNVEPSSNTNSENSTVSFTEMKPMDDFLSGFDFGSTNTAVTPETTSNFGMNEEVTPVVPVEPIVEAPVEPEAVPVEQSVTTSYTEIPVASVTESKPERSSEPTMIEHPDAKISLHRNRDEDLPKIKEPTETVDKSTIWLLVGLFVGLLLVILALPYISKLF